MHTVQHQVCKLLTAESPTPGLLLIVCGFRSLRTTDALPPLKGSLLIFYHCLLIIFTFLPNSAMSERVFALVKNMFGSDQLSTLADFLQASLMLASNGRKVG